MTTEDEKPIEVSELIKMDYKGLKRELFDEKGNPKCLGCGKSWTKLNKEKDFGYYKPSCKCIPKNLRLSVG